MGRAARSKWVEWVVAEVDDREAFSDAMRSTEQLTGFGADGRMVEGSMISMVTR